jgi:beta-glucosidase
VSENGTVICPTNFPNGPAMGAMFDRDLVKRMAEIIGTELRTMFVLNISQGSLDCWGPVINLGRDPRWGRNGEGEWN